MTSQQTQAEWVRQYRMLEQHLFQFRAQVERVEEDLRYVKTGKDILNSAYERLHLSNEASRSITPALSELYAIVKVSSGLQRDERLSQLRQLERISLDTTKRLSDCNRELQLEYEKLKSAYVDSGDIPAPQQLQIQHYRSAAGGSDKLAQEQVSKELAHVSEEVEATQVVYAQMSTLVSRQSEKVTRVDELVSHSPRGYLQPSGLHEDLDGVRLRNQVAFRRKCVIITIVAVAVGLLCLAILLVVGIRR